MAKYIKQEMPDMAGTGEKKVYYRMKTEQHFDSEKFVKWMTRYGGLGRGEAMRVLMQTSETKSVVGIERTAYLIAASPSVSK